MQNLINTLPKAKLWTLIFACLLILNLLITLIQNNINVVFATIFNTIFIIILFGYRSACSKLETDANEETLINFCRHQRYTVTILGILLGLALLIVIIGIITAIILPRLTS